MNASIIPTPYAVLAQVRQYRTQAEVAQALSVTARTVRRWEARESEPPSYLAPALWQMLPTPSKQEQKASDFKFIDLFAGIGGIRQAFESAGGHCVFTSEWDDYAQKTYVENFGQDGHRLQGDITKIPVNEVPDHDVLLAGFPCQPFSIAGVSKKNALGRAHGFDAVKRKNVHSKKNSPSCLA